MSIMDVLSVKWWALLIGIVVNFIVGMLWYGPIFGKAWMKLVGLTEEQIQSGGNNLLYVFSLLSAFFSTYVLAILLNLADVQTVPAAIGIGLLMWFGFFFMPLANHSMYESRPAKLVLINGFYSFTTVLIVSIVLQVAR